jgi:ketosteroid isomerase-like protein
MSLTSASGHLKIACLSLPALISAGNLDAATACFARDACLVTQDATAIHERDHIRPLLAQLIARHARIAADLRNLVVAGEVAFARERWRIQIDAVEGSRFEQACDPVLVLRRVEGRWKLALVAPWGWGEARL